MLRVLGFLIIFLIATVANAVTVTRYVNTASAGGNGTTNATVGVNAAYVSLAAWQAAEVTDLVAAGNTHKVIVSGITVDANPVVVDGWTTDATHYVLITCDSSIANSCHHGALSTTHYALQVSSAWATALTINDDFVRINGFQIVKQSTSAIVRSAIRVYSITSGGDTRISNMVIRGDLAGAGVGRGVWLKNPAAKAYLWNNIIYNFSSVGSSGIMVDAASAAALNYIYNNTVVNCAIGYSGTLGTERYKNNVAYSCTDGWFGIADALSTYNASSLPAGDALGSSPIDSAVVNFRGVSDYHLKSSSTDVIDKGIDLTADPNWVGATTNDIDAEARGGAGTWDVGADEYTAPVGLPLRLLTGVGS